MKDYCIIITTYDRIKPLKALIEQLQHQLKGKDYVICIYDDATPSPEDLSDKNIIHHVFPYNHGKMNFWKIWNHIMTSVPEARYYISLQDDCELMPNAIKLATKYWNDITDPDKILLEIQADQRTGKKQWGATPVEFGSIYYLQGWTDFMFICERKLFEALEFKIKPIPISRWEQNPRYGSGVASQISRRLKQYHLYALKFSLVKRLDLPSKMNPNPLEKLISI